ncbi:MAG: hypothetical protein MUD12_08935 [Spirochaetes bacterium]|jgi:hypothetical protein|nr:hypothetical protein [Spirochaetota bacterium]
MIEKYYEYKPPREKLIKIHMKTDGFYILGIMITGDFFILPEQGIDPIESSLLDSSLDSKEILSRVNSAIMKNGIELVGVSSESLTEAIIRTVE